MIGLFDYDGTGGGGTGDLQAVTDLGNTTTNAVISDNGHGQALLFSDGRTGRVEATTGAGTSIALIANSLTATGVLSYVDTGGGTAVIEFNGNSPLPNFVNTFNFRTAAGGSTNDVAFLSDITAAQVHRGHFSQTFTGATITIPHGLLATPTYADIVSTTPPGAQLIAPGYYMAYSSTNITVHLITPIVSVIFLELDWFAIT